MDDNDPILEDPIPYKFAVGMVALAFVISSFTTTGLFVYGHLAYNFLCNIQ